MDQLVEGGLGTVSLRAAARAATLSLGSIQYHFASHAAFALEVVTQWRREVTRALLDRARPAQGIQRVLALCNAWVNGAAGPQTFLAAVEGTRGDVQDELEPARRELRAAIDEWLELTRRALRQARYLGQLRPDVDLQSLTLALHRDFWSVGWGCHAYGQDGSARLVLESVWDRLANVAAEPARVLPTRQRFLSGVATVDTEPLLQPIPPGADGRPAPDWRILFGPDDPQFHAYERHEVMDDRRDLYDPPPVLAVDVAAARRYVEARGPVTTPAAESPPA